MRTEAAGPLATADVVLARLAKAGETDAAVLAVVREALRPAASSEGAEGERAG